jgi:hypothetical protein
VAVRDQLDKFGAKRPILFCNEYPHSAHPVWPVKSNIS